MKATSLLAVLALVGTTAACQNQANRPGAATITQGEAPAEGGEAAPAAPAAAPADDGSRNTSTTLGDGTSGMYTGGQGTYGGRATWGTGGAAPAAAPAPAEPAAPAEN